MRNIDINLKSIFTRSIVIFLPTSAVWDALKRKKSSALCQLISILKLLSSLISHQPPPPSQTSDKTSVEAYGNGKHNITVFTLLRKKPVFFAWKIQFTIRE